MRNGFWVLVGIIVILAVLIYPAACYNSQAEHIITVKSKTDSASGDSGHKMLIQTVENDWYQSGDVWWKGHFRSRDVWGAMEEGHTYRVKTVGWRIGFFSWYPKIYEIEETKPQ